MMQDLTSTNRFHDQNGTHNYALSPSPYTLNYLDDVRPPAGELELGVEDAHLEAQRLGGRNRKAAQLRLRLPGQHRGAVRPVH